MDMDFREPPRADSHESPASESHIAPTKKKSGKGKKLLWWLIVLLLLAGAAAAGWYYRDTQAKDDEKVLKAEIVALKAENESLEKELAAAKAADVAEAASQKPSQQDLDNIEAAIKSGNYAALEQLMASKVTVILAASEGLGERTVAQAIEDLKYINSGTDPWNCDLPAATIDQYQAGDYKQYFPDGAVVCKSANDYVVSVSFNAAGKINTIFMANSADVL